MNQDKDFIIQVIQYVQYNHGIDFFITTKDFDSLYNWWEKRIPLRIIKESITNVITRWQEKSKTIKSFSNFNYEVKKNFKSFLQLNLGSSEDSKDDDVSNESGEYEEIESFFNNYPEELKGLKSDFEKIYEQLKINKAIGLTQTNKKLIELFKDDYELNLQTRMFLRNLSPGYQNQEIEQRYRLNFLKNKFNIPDFEGFNNSLEN